VLGIECEAHRDEDEPECDPNRGVVDVLVLVIQGCPANAALAEEREDPARGGRSTARAYRAAVGDEEAGEDEEATGEIEAECERSPESSADDRADDERDDRGGRARCRDQNYKAAQRREPEVPGTLRCRR
jgi:hypothetical protein